MVIVPKLEPGQLVEASIAGEKYLALVVSTRHALRRGQSPMIYVRWCGNSPRNYEEEHVEESLLRIVK